MDVDLPADAALSATQDRHVQNFVDAVKAIKYDACTSCRERDWNRDVRDGVCKRCRDEKERPRKWSKENKTQPMDGGIPPCLQGMTEVEEMIISPAKVHMQVRYTRG
ncbi:hypothetical protein FB107DRAFT_193571, partial [Schizophyllum commune]